MLENNLPQALFSINLLDTARAMNPLGAESLAGSLNACWDESTKSSPMLIYMEYKTQVKIMRQHQKISWKKQLKISKIARFLYHISCIYWRCGGPMLSVMDTELSSLGSSHVWGCYTYAVLLTKLYLDLENHSHSLWDIYIVGSASLLPTLPPTPYRINRWLYALALTKLWWISAPPSPRPSPPLLFKNLSTL